MKMEDVDNQDKNKELFNIGRCQRNKFFEGSGERGFLAEYNEW